MTDDPEPLDLDLLREAAEAGFHATPPTVLALLNLVAAQAELLALHEDPEAGAAAMARRLHVLYVVPDPPEPEPEPEPGWVDVPLPLEDL